MFSDFDSYSQYYGISNRQNPFEINSFDNNPGYNIQSNMSNGFDTRQMTGIDISKNLEIISFNQAINMIRKNINNYGNEEIFYNELIKNISDKKIEKIVKDIREDDRKHNRFLKEVYSNLTGQMVPIDNYQTPNISKDEKKEHDISEQLEIILFDKLDNVVKLRKILSVMPNGVNYTLMFAILTDELKNSTKINYLIHMNKG